MYFEHENGLKHHIGPFFALIGPFRTTNLFYQPLDHLQVLQIIITHHNVQSWEKLMHFEQQNGLKPHFGPFLALIGPILGPTKIY